MFYEGCTIDEIRAYRELESEEFDFGEGEMKIEGWYGSEDAYYEMCLPEESGFDEYDYEYNCHKVKPKSKKKYKLHQYHRKKIDRIKLDKLSKVSWWIVSTRKGYKRRCYYSSRKKIAKKITNKKVRKYKGKIGDHGNYRKIYDYWWTVF